MPPIVRFATTFLFTTIVQLNTIEKMQVRLTTLCSLLRIILLSIVCSHSSSSSVAGDANSAGTKIRIVSWNLNWFPGKRPEPTADEETTHMALAQQALRELKPDILLLQEVRDWKSAEQLCSVVPNLRVHVISRFQPRPQNQAIASTLPVDSTWSAEWQHGADGPPRGYVFAAIELPKQRFLLAYSLHLKSNVGTPAVNVSKRQESGRQLLVHAQEMQNLYTKRGVCGVLVGGDMNTSLDDPKFAKEQTLHALLAAGFHWSFAGVPFAERITIPKEDNYPDNCFDHIFTAGLGKQTAFVKPYPSRSDHNPVVLDLDLSKADFQSRIGAAEGLALLKTAPPAPASKESINVTAFLNANDHDAVRAAVGKIVAVRGKVHDVSRTKTGSINFINFAGNERGQFVGIVKSESLTAVTDSLGGELKTMLTARAVELRGEVVLYKGIPEIVVSTGNQIQVLADVAGEPSGQIPATGGKFVASTNSKVFHKAGCSTAAKIADKNLVSFATREDAIQAGKRPCAECKP